MKKNIYLYGMALLLIGMISCNKEVITNEDPEIIIDPPIEIDYPVAKGIVMDKDGKLSATQIVVYQKNELKGETTSNENGEFSTIDIETIPGEDLILEFIREDYSTSYRKRSEMVLKASSLNVEMISDQEIFGSSSSIPNPNSEDYISLSGNIKNFQGEPSRASIAVEYMIGNIYYGATTLTDSDGYYELLLAKDTELSVSIFSDTICFDYLTAEEVSIFANLQAEVMGPFSEDVILDDYINPYITARVFQLSGQVQSCDGLASTISEVEVTINDNEDKNYVYVISSHTDGTFSVSENDCVSIPYSVTIVGKDLENNMHSDTTIIEVSEVIYINDDIQLTACIVTETEFSTAVMNINGTDYSFTQINTRLENGDMIADDMNTLSFGLFTIPNIQLGDNNILSLEMGDWQSGDYFKAVNEVMGAEVTSLSANEAIVSITGDFFDANGIVVEGTCILNLQF